MKKAMEAEQGNFQHKYDKLYSIWGSQQNSVNKLDIELVKTSD